MAQINRLPQQRKRLSGLQSKNIVMANSLNRSAMGLNLSEKRIVACALAKLNGLNGLAKITAKEYAETFNLPLNQAYEQMKESAKGMLSRAVTVFLEDEERRETTMYPWFSIIKYEENEGYVGVKFNAEIAPFLFDVTERFTQYQLLQASSLRSLYSWRLLEKFEQFRTKKDGIKSSSGWYKTTVEEFAREMEVPDSYLNNFKNLRIRVIEPAIKELVEKDGWKIEFIPEKEGRKVARLHFKFERA